MHTRAKFSAVPQKDPDTCFFNYGKPLLQEPHDRRAHTFKLGGKVKQYALDMECIDITNKIGTSDMVAVKPLRGLTYTNLVIRCHQSLSL